jgi:hypothetical protein
VTLERVGADNVTVLQSDTAAAGFSAAAIAWENRVGGTVTTQLLRVRAGSCAGPCAAGDTYRLRVHETSGAASRFNNSGSQVTILILQNTGDTPVAGHADFWSPAGVRRATVAWTAAARGTSVLNTSTVPGLDGASGSVTVTSDAPYGSLAGKAVVVEPATGFSFDTPVIPRTR